MPPLLTADLSLRASAHTGVAIRTSWQANSLPGITNQALIIQPDASGLFLIPTYDPSEQRDLQIHRVDLILRDAEIAFGYRPAEVDLEEPKITSVRGTTYLTFLNFRCNGLSTALYIHSKQ